MRKLANTSNPLKSSPGALFFRNPLTTRPPRFCHGKYEEEKIVAFRPHRGGDIFSRFGDFIYCEQWGGGRRFSYSNARGYESIRMVEVSRLMARSFFRAVLIIVFAKNIYLNIQGSAIWIWNIFWIVQFADSSLNNAYRFRRFFSYEYNLFYNQRVFFYEILDKTAHIFICETHMSKLPIRGG